MFGGIRRPHPCIGRRQQCRDREQAPVPVTRMLPRNNCFRMLRRAGQHLRDLPDISLRIGERRRAPSPRPVHWPI